MKASTPLSLFAYLARCSREDRIYVRKAIASVTARPLVIHNR